MSPSAVLDRVRKLRARAERQDGPEADRAAERAASLMRSYGLEKADVQDIVLDVPAPEEGFFRQLAWAVGRARGCRVLLGVLGVRYEGSRGAVESVARAYPLAAAVLVSQCAVRAPQRGAAVWFSYFLDAAAAALTRRLTYLAPQGEGERRPPEAVVALAEELAEEISIFEAMQAAMGLAERAAAAGRAFGDEIDVFGDRRLLVECQSCLEFDAERKELQDRVDDLLEQAADDGVERERLRQQAAAAQAEADRLRRQIAVLEAECARLRQAAGEIGRDSGGGAGSTLEIT